MCDACLANLQAHRELLRSTGPATLPAPAAAELERHAARFGPELVEETAAEYGVRVAVARPRAKSKARGGPTLRQRVAGYVAAGYGVEVVASMENISPSRARRLIEEVS